MVSRVTATQRKSRGGIRFGIPLEFLNSPVFGALPVVVTLVGWLILAKGFTLLVLAPDEMTAMVQRMGFAEHYRLLLTPALVLGLYLTWAGFSSRSAHQN
jgi:hypothetical protein